LRSRRFWASSRASGCRGQRRLGFEASTNFGLSRPAHRRHPNDGNERAAADYLGISLGLVQAAVAYYGAYRDEIDEWIEFNARETEAAHEAWLAGKPALKR
jgi:hypothetical protein